MSRTDSVYRQLRGHLAYLKLGAAAEALPAALEAARTDKVGYLPMPADAAAHLFAVISRRYQKTPIMLTTNRGVASWGDIFTDTSIAAAMLDRRLHHSVVFNIDGDSYRLRAHQARNRARRPKGDTID